jgi:hypothetical protein
LHNCVKNSSNIGKYIHSKETEEWNLYTKKPSEKGWLLIIIQ